MWASPAKNKAVENVLVMQGGGSLGAFACGVYKGLVKRNVRIDILAGTSIGAVNAAIIVGSKSDHPEKDLEEFWLEIAESTPNSESVERDRLQAISVGMQAYNMKIDLLTNATVVERAVQFVDRKKV